MPLALVGFSNFLVGSGVISSHGYMSWVLYVFSGDDGILYLQVVINQWNLKMRQDGRLQKNQCFASIIVASLEGQLP